MVAVVIQLDSSDFYGRLRPQRTCRGRAKALGDRACAADVNWGCGALSIRMSAYAGEARVTEPLHTLQRGGQLGSLADRASR